MITVSDLVSAIEAAGKEQHPSVQFYFDAEDPAEAVLDMRINLARVVGHLNGAAVMLTGYETQVALPRLRSRGGEWWSARELCVTPDSLRKLAEAGLAERDHDGRRWRYRAVENGPNGNTD